MRILIATAGELAVDPVADFVAGLPERNREVFIATVIEVPRSFLDEIRSQEWHPLDDAASWSSEEDEVIARYVEERGARITDPVVAALQSRDISATTMFLEGEDPAETIVTNAAVLEADLVVLGATKRLFDESQWESVTSRVIRDAGRPVLVVPPAKRDDTGEIDLPTSELALD